LLLTVAGFALSSAITFAADSVPTNAAAEKPKRREGTKWDLMEHGPFLSSYMEATPRINKCVSINLGNEATVASFPSPTPTRRCSRCDFTGRSRRESVSPLASRRTALRAAA
jgi:hypothetical protein